jgi:hypothetical protein
MRYTIHPERVGELVAKLEKLAKRAAKLGCEALRWVVGEPRRELDPETHEPRVLVDVEVDGAAPSYQGWTFVASVERYGDELLVTTAPGETVPADFDRTALAQTCDHCKASRGRKQTFLVRHEDGRTLRVGSTCIKDFLGHNLPSLGMFRILRELDEFAGGLGEGRELWSVDLVAFLTVVAMHIRAGGFVSRGRASEDMRLVATADEVLGWYAAAAKGKRVEEPTDADAEMAGRVLQWALDVDAEGNDYLTNVQVVARAGFVMDTTVGIAASIQSAAGRAWEREVKEQAARNLAETSDHFGTVGERASWQVTVLGCYTTEGYYGTTFIYKFVTADGNAATWFSSRSADIEVGESCWLTGTVKKHDTYRGTAETHLTRCKVSTDEPPKPRKRKAKKATPPNPNVEAGEDVTIEPEGDGCWVWGHSTYGDSSVLAGQCRRRRIECFETVEQARAEYPRATVCEGANSAWNNREDRYSFDRSVQPGWFDPADAGETW